MFRKKILMMSLLVALFFLTSAASATIYVNGEPYNGVTGYAPLTCHFVAADYANGTTFQWTFLNSVHIKGPEATWTFNQSGTYTVWFEWWNGGYGEAGLRVVVLPPKPVPDFTCSPQTGTAPLSVTFRDNSQNTSGCTYAWKVDGQSITLPQGTTVLPDQTFAIGNHSVVLTLTQSGVQYTVTKYIQVYPRPIANITASPVSGKVPLTVNFNGSTSQNAVTYSWDFKDGTQVVTGTNAKVSREFTNPGTYPVTLTVTSANGFTDSKSVTITAIPLVTPVASLVADSASGKIPLPVNFDLSASTGVSSYSLDFGDGTAAAIGTDVTAAVAHQYAKDGTFTATLTVKSADGLTDSKSVTITVLPLIKPTASIIVTPTSGKIPLPVNFDLSNSKDVANYSLDFRDGTVAVTGTDVSAAIAHQYEKAGTYTAILTVTSSDGLTDSQSVTITAIPLVTPTASLTADPLSGKVPLTVNFDGSASTDAAEYSWNFGDGRAVVTGTQNTISHTYAKDGTFTATLTVKSADGLTDSKSATITVLPLVKPVAAFTADPTSGKTPLLVNFDATASTDAQSYSWKLANGTNLGTDKIFSKTFTDAGTYDVTLTVTSADGLTDSKVATITVIPLVQPVASLIVTPTSGKVPLNANFDLSGCKDVSSYSLNFGDNTPALSGTDVSQIVNHQYAIDGTFTATLTVKSSDGLTDSTAAAIKVIPLVKPVAAFTVDNVSGKIPFTPNFDATSSKDAVSYRWNFGDGTPVVSGTDAIVSHEYSTPGTYWVALTVTSADGLTNTKSTNVEAMPLIEPVAMLNAEPTEGKVPLDVMFNFGDSVGVANFKLNFGDGSEPVLGTDITQVFTHRYEKAGTYIAILNVTSVDKLEAGAHMVIVVKPLVKPVTDFTVAPASGKVPFTSSFNAVSSKDAVSYRWDFGDGTPVLSRTDKVVSHEYDTAGTYPVTLTVTSVDGLTDSMTVSVEAIPLVKPVAAFTADPTSGKTPLLVNFDATASTDAQSYSWKLADGTDLGTDKIFSKTFTDAGTYDVTLTVTSADGLTDSKVATITVQPLDPVADFTLDPSSGVAPLTVTVADASQNVPAGSTYAYTLDNVAVANADGMNVPAPMVGLTAGQHTVVLTITTPDARTYSATHSVDVSPAPVDPIIPVAAFTATPMNGNAPLVVNFDASSSQNAASYSWKLGDGTDLGTAPSFTHSFDEGTYEVTLAVTSTDGHTDAITKTITATAAAPIPFANFTVTPTSGIEPLDINLTDNSINSEGCVYNWTIDGESIPVVEGTNLPENQTLFEGNHTIILTLMGADGSMYVSQPQYVVVGMKGNGKTPVAHFKESPRRGNEDLTVNFTDKSRRNPTSWHWDFGDGNVSEEQNPTHIFTESGTYEITLTVSNDAGSDSKTKKVKVKEWPKPPVASFTADPRKGNEDLTVNFTDTSNKVPTAWHWDFGDGQVSDEQNTTHTYTAAGSYDVTLTVSNDGGSDTKTKTIIVKAWPKPPVASFKKDISYLAVQFTDTSDKEPTSWHWDFGDGQVSDEQNTTHTYAAAGTYTVTLTVSNDGGSDTKTETIEVKQIPKPVASFKKDVTYLAVQFTDTSNKDPTAWHWDFGDGSTSDQQNPSHTYSAAGTYTVTLTASNDGGNDIKTNNVRVRAQK